MLPSPDGLRVLCRACNSRAMAEQREAALTEGDAHGGDPLAGSPSHRALRTRDDYSPADVTLGDGE
jgi:hypothetical protein